MTAYYNEFDPKAAAWLRELIRCGLIADGIVDDRSIEDVTPADLSGFAQVHFFAGIGVWSYALRQAGWADDRPVWTGSCPCQPFSAAGKGGGFADERHLWPAFHYLIDQCRPDVVFGEQVASKDGLGWLDLVQADLEGTGYASGAVDLCAAGVGAPHIRQRLWWFGERLAHPESDRHQRSGKLREQTGRDGVAHRSPGGWMADNFGSRLEGRDARSVGQQRQAAERNSPGELGGLADSDGGHAGEERQQRGGEQRQQPQDGGTGLMADADGWRREADEGQIAGVRGGSLGAEHGGMLANRPAGPTNGLWADADWLHCRDGKWRPVEPGTFPLAHGAAERVGRLRGYGNAIVAPCAQAFIEAYLETQAADDGRLRLTSMSLLSTGVFD